MLKLSRSGITTLKRLYKSVLMKCLLINAGILLTANVAAAADYTYDPSATVATNLAAFHSAISGVGTYEDGSGNTIDAAFAAAHPNTTRAALSQLLSGSSDAAAYAVQSIATGDFVNLTGGTISLDTLGVDVSKGLATDDPYNGANYIAGATTMANADMLLDSAINNIEKTGGTIDTRIDAFKTKVENGTVIAGEAAKLTGVTASAAELNKLSGVTATTAQINYLSGVTSDIQTQINSKQNSLNTDQLAAANSGITAAKVSAYEGYAAAIAGKQNSLNTDQLAAVDSGITAAKVSAYEGYATAIAGKQNSLTTDQLAAADSGITAAKVSAYDGYATAIAGKQNSLTTDQLAAADSGITAAKVSTYDGYAAAIAGKQAALSSDQLAATNSGVNATKIGQYDALVTAAGSYGDIVSHNASEFQTALNSGQLSAVNSGVNATKIGQYDALVTAAGSYGDIVSHNASEFQTALSSSQLSAVNSGIDATKVGQIATNTSNIAANTTAIAGKVDNTRKINGHALSADVTLDANDVLTTAQQSAVNSGITAANVTQIGTNATDIANITSGTTNIAYDNTTSGLTATTVKGAIDEIDSNVDAISADVGSMAALQAGVADTTSAIFKRGNLTNGSTTALAGLTVADALTNIDLTMGKIHGLVTNNGDGTYTYAASSGSYTLDYTNLATGTTVEEDVLSLNLAVGNRNYVTRGYAGTLLANNQSVADSILNIANKTDVQDTGLSNIAGALGVTYTPASGAISATSYSSNNYVANGDSAVTAIGKLDSNLKTLDGGNAKLSASNIFTGATNTFGSTVGSQVIITNGGSATVDQDLTVGDELKIGAANSVTGTAGTLNMGNNALTGVKGLTLTDGSNTAALTVDATSIKTGDKSFDVGTGSLNAQSLNVGSADQFTVDGSGNISTGGTLTAGASTLGATTVTSLGLDSATLTNVDKGTAAITGGNAATIATTATLLKSAENATYTGTKVTGGSNATVGGALSETNTQVNTNTSDIATLKTNTTVVAAQVTTANHLTAGADLAGNVVSVANALANTEAVIGSETGGYAAGTALAGKTIAKGDASTDVTVAGAIGTLNNAVKTNADNIGDLSTLTTTANTSLVAAVNEVDANADAANLSASGIAAKIGGSIAAGGAFTADAYTSTNNYAAGSTLVAAISGIDSKVGNLTSLTTTANTTLVAAINEVSDAAKLANNTIGAGTFGTGTGQIAGTAGDLTGKTIGTTYTVSQALADLNATNVNENASLNTLAGLINGQTVGADGSLAGTATALNSGTGVGKFTATNLTGAANELLNDITVTTAGTYITTGANVAGNLAALDTQVKKNADDIADTAAIIGTPQTSAAISGLLTGKAITGDTSVTGHTSIIDAISLVADTAAGKALNNTFTGTNTFGNTAGSQVIIDNGGNLTVNKDLTIGKANAITSNTTGELNMGNNALTGVKGLTLTDGTNTAALTVDASGIKTGNASLDVGNGTLYAKELSIGSTDQFTVDASGNIVTTGTLKTGAATVDSLAIGTTGKGFDGSGNITAGTIKATGIDTTTANTVKLGGSGFTTEVTGGFKIGSSNAITSSSAALIDMGANSLTNVNNVTATGTVQATDLAATNGLTVNTNKFVVTNTGATTMADKLTVTAGGADITGNSSNTGTFTIKNTGTDSATFSATNIILNDGGTATPVANVLKVDSKAALYSGELASEKGLNVITDTDLDGKYDIMFRVNDKGEAQAASLAFNGDGGTAFVNTIDQGGTAITNGVVNPTGQQTMATNATVAKTVGDIATLATASHGISSATSVADALSSLSNNVETATGVSYSATGAVTTTFTKAATTDYDGLNANQSLRAAIEQLDGNIGTAITGTTRTVTGGTTAAASTVNANIAALDAAIGADITGTTRALAAGTTAANKSANDNIKALDAAIGADITGITRTVTGGTTAANKSVNDNIKALDATIGGDVTAAKGNIAKTNTVNQNFDSIDLAIGDRAYKNNVAVNYAAVTTGADVTAAISQVASNIGTATVTGYNGVIAGQTVNANIDAVNAQIGDWSGLNSTYVAGASNGNAITNGGDNVPATVVAALNNIDATLGTIHGLSAKLESAGTYQGNLATGTTVEQHLTSLDTAIGDRSRFNDMKYAQGSQSVVDAIGKLDSGLYDLDHEVRRLRHHFEGGMASAAALSALQPNARATGDTQLAIGTGAYKGHGAVAFGGYHWFTDNLLVNVGVAHDNREATYRMGVTYSW